ncbi:GAP family protein [Komagataeibacter swingsii]|uniref:Uncharacterized protein n=1 Tax=Komagataeibacter swingsii TaxID=215220 RepID=A0A850P4S9_9PROT|nr:GAP family protein [Komagataeibacter swingsii]NVN38083.1 hypothetical protein [Komagataeibacter swingsii]
MTGALEVITLAMADSVNPVAIGMVLESLVVRRTARHAVLFTLSTLVINTVFAWLLIQGFDLIGGIRQSRWPAVLVVLAGCALVAQGLFDAARAWRNPDAKTRLRFSIADAGAAKTVLVAAVVSLALLPFGGQVAIAMLEVSAMQGGALFNWGWAVFYSVIYTLPLWVLIGLGLTPLRNWRARSAIVRRYGAAAAGGLFGMGLILLGLLS